MNSDVADVVRWVATPAAGAIGGLAARILLHRPSVFVAVVAGFLVGFAIAVIDHVVGSAPDTAASTLSPPAPHVPPASGFRWAARAPVSTAPVQREEQWWDATQRPTASPAAMVEKRSEPRPAPVDLAGYLPRRKRGRIPQCPRCGDFAVSVMRGPNGHRFSCTACGGEWNWAEGAPWPAVRINPRARRLQ